MAGFRRIILDVEFSVYLKMFVMCFDVTGVPINCLECRLTVFLCVLLLSYYQDTQEQIHDDDDDDDDDHDLFRYHCRSFNK